ncbi:MAG: methionine--tRNA ligase [Candidatus Hodarchaeota archaeon]
MKKKFMITTPIYYANNVAHIGHAYTSLAADIVARFYRLLDYDVFFLTGSDEHGKKIENAAKKAGMEPKAFVDKINAYWIEMNKSLNISIDHFVRTTDDYHIEFCKEIYNLMKDNGDIYKGEYKGLYCVECEKYIREVELVDGKCPFHKVEPEILKEESYFFKFSKYAKPLLDYYEKNPNFISPAFKKQEIVNRIKEGLEDLSISRKSLKWGIQLPDDPNHVMYVWIDALSNYISALRYPGEKYKKYWPADVHLIGKDILWFHSAIWPAMLMSAGLPLPKKVFAHGFWQAEGNKMSKTLGNVVSPDEMKENYGLEAFRYYLFSKAQFGQDNDFYEKELVDVLNTELADDFGNLVNRIIVLTQKYFQGKVPFPEKVSSEEKSIESNFDIVDNIIEYYKNFDFSRVVRTIWEQLRGMNKYITDKEPWVLFKNKEMEKLEEIQFCLLEGLRILAILLQPILPDTCAKIFEALGIKHKGFDVATWRNEKGFNKTSKLKAKKLILFTKKEFVEEKEGEKEEAKMEKSEKIKGKPQVTYNDFQKLDIRSAKILEVEEFPDSKKLVKLKVECGSETRTVIAGIGKYYNTEELKDKNIIIIINLKPRKIHGVLSEGMLLAVDINGEPVLLIPDKDVKSGLPIA